MAIPIKVQQHKLTSANFVASPNCDDRPIASELDLIVIHNISLPPGQFGTGCIQQLFTNTLDCSRHEYFASLSQLKVSSHLLIERDAALTQFVPFNKRAWHAGESYYEGRNACNDFSIGIELEGTDDDEFTRQQYQRLKEVLICLLATYPRLNSQAIVGHSDIAPGRKTDPGPKFDWQQIKF